MTSNTNNDFIFQAHAFRVNGPKVNGDSDVIFSVDKELRNELAFFNFIEPDQTLEIVVRIKK